MLNHTQCSSAQNTAWLIDEEGMSQGYRLLWGLFVFLPIILHCLFAYTVHLPKLKMGSTINSQSACSGPLVLGAGCWVLGRCSKDPKLLTEPLPLGCSAAINELI